MLRPEWPYEMFFFNLRKIDNHNKWENYANVAWVKLNVGSYFPPSKNKYFVQLKICVTEKLQLTRYVSIVYELVY